MQDFPLFSPIFSGGLTLSHTGESGVPKQAQGDGLSEDANGFL
jgi:hypothetical protein